jgi:hypothetical protein
MNGTCLSDVSTSEQCDITTEPDDLDLEGKNIVVRSVSQMLKLPNVVNGAISTWFLTGSLVRDGGVSPTVIAFGWLRTVPGCTGIVNLPAILKCFVDDPDPRHDVDVKGMHYESRVYECVVANMMTVPFFAVPYGVLSKKPCLSDNIEMALVKYLQPDKRTRTVSRPKYAVCNYIVMEHCGSVSLDKKVRTCDGNTFIQLSLQMLSALKTLQENRITHNDMHWNNVLVKEGSPCFFMDIETGAVLPDDASVRRATISSQNRFDTARVDAGNLVKIFDWDVAVAHTLRNNPKTSLIASHTQTFKKMYDTFGFIKSWLRVIKSYKGRKTEENRAINEQCEKAFWDCFMPLHHKYPWVLEKGQGAYLQTVCLPTEDESQRKINATRNHEDDCAATWPEYMNEEYELAVALFTSRLAQMLPISNRFIFLD